MNVLWEGVKATAGILGQAAVETGKKGKLQADLLLIVREIENTPMWYVCVVVNNAAQCVFACRVRVIG
jgi:hypothetical protein